MKFCVRLMRITRDYVEILVDEEDIETAQHAIDFVNEQMEDPDWDPVEKAMKGSDYVDINQPFEVLDVKPAPTPSGPQEILPFPEAD